MRCHHFLFQATFVCALVVTRPVLSLSEPSQGQASPHFESFTLAAHEREDSNTERYRFVDGSSVLRLKVISGVLKPAAERLIENEILSTRALYNDALAPYPDAVSNRIEIDKTLIPQLKTSESAGVVVRYFVPYLSASMTYGVQSAQDAPYRGVLAWAFCPEQKEMRTLELIRPKASFGESDESFAVASICKR